MAGSAVQDKLYIAGEKGFPWATGTLADGAVVPLNLLDGDKGFGVGPEVLITCEAEGKKAQKSQGSRHTGQVADHCDRNSLNIIT